VKTLVGHNIAFDLNVIKSELFRLKMSAIIKEMDNKKIVCTMSSAMKLKVNGKFKPPSLKDLYKHLFNKEQINCHNSKFDTLCTSEVYQELVKKDIIKN
jgi:DNA polymerase III epsilon subunit-like protein